MNIQITEHKSQDVLRFNNVVRVFVNRDMTYGYWIDEQLLYSMLTDSERAEYLDTEGTVSLDVSPVVAQAIIDHGTTPYSKLTVWTPTETSAKVKYQIVVYNDSECELFRSDILTADEDADHLATIYRVLAENDIMIKPGDQIRTHYED